MVDLKEQEIVSLAEELLCELITKQEIYRLLRVVKGPESLVETVLSC